MFPTDLGLSTLALGATILACATSDIVRAQNLRHGVQSAELVVVARVAGVRPLGDDLILHTLEVQRVLRGAETATKLTIVESKRISDQPRPTVATSASDVTRVYCLRGAKHVERLPKRFRPYFRMTGFTGDNPVVRLDAEPIDTHLRFIALLERSEHGIAPRTCCAELIEIGLRGTGSSRTEAIQLLREREVVRATLIGVEKSNLLARAVGESKDSAYKLALASLCAEVRMPGVIEALCLSIENNQDPEFARTLGRLARFRHGEQAVEILRPQIIRARKTEVRDALLLALGATETERALEALLQYRRVNGSSTAIDAALRAHGTRRALDATASKPERRTPQDNK